MSSATVAMAAAQIGEAQVAHVHAIEQDTAFLRVVEARHQRGERGLARARAPDHRDGAAGRDLEVEPAQDRPVGVIAEA